MDSLVKLVACLILALCIILLGFRLAERVIDHGRFSAPKAETPLRDEGVPQ
jgi:hypothetical protein